MRCVQRASGSRDRYLVTTSRLLYRYISPVSIPAGIAKARNGPPILGGMALVWPGRSRYIVPLCDYPVFRTCCRTEVRYRRIIIISPATSCPLVSVLCCSLFYFLRSPYHLSMELFMLVIVSGLIYPRPFWDPMQGEGKGSQERTKGCHRHKGTPLFDHRSRGLVMMFACGCSCSRMSLVLVMLQALPILSVHS